MIEQKPKRILVIGSINMDLVLTLDRAPEAGETVLGESYAYIPGGKGANQAVAAARLNGEVFFCGRVGSDSNGKILLENLADNKVNTSYITVDDSSQTGLAVIPVDSEGQNRIMVFPGSNYLVSREDVDRAMQESYDAIMLQLEIPLDIVYYAFEKAKAKGIPVVLDAAPAVEVDLSRLKGLYILSPNEYEASKLTGIKADSVENALKAAEILRDSSSADYVIIKMGDKGALLYDKGHYEMIPSYPVKAVDTTAAGDSFTAAVTVKALEHGNIAEAVRYANAVGAICVSRRGAQPSLPTEEEVRKFLKGESI